MLADSLRDPARETEIAAALEALSAKQSTAFSLRYLEGLSIDEVAEAMSISAQVDG